LSPAAAGVGDDGGLAAIPLLAKRMARVVAAASLGPTIAIFIIVDGRRILSAMMLGRRLLVLCLSRLRKLCLSIYA